MSSEFFKALEAYIYSRTRFQGTHLTPTIFGNLLKSVTGSDDIKQIHLATVGNSSWSWTARAEIVSFFILPLLFDYSRVLNHKYSAKDMVTTPTLLSTNDYKLTNNDVDMANSDQNLI